MLKRSRAQRLDDLVSDASLNRLIKLVAASLVAAILGYAAYIYADRYGLPFGTQEDQTIAAARRVVEQEPENVTARNHLATLYLDKDMQDAAIAETNEALRISPDNSRSLTIQGLAYYQKGEVDTALERFERVIEVNAGHKWSAFIQDVNNASYFAGEILVEQGEYSRAVENLRRALVLDNADADAHHYLGRALYGLGRYEEALEELSIAASFIPTEAHYHYYRALALEKTGDLEEARKALELALSHRKDYPEAREALERLTSAGSTANDGTPAR